MQYYVLIIHKQGIDFCCSFKNICLAIFSCFCDYKFTIVCVNAQIIGILFKASLWGI